MGVAALLALATGAPSARAQAQQAPVPEQPSTAPQLEIEGAGIATLDIGRDRTPLPGGGRASSSQVNLSDSALMLGAAQRLYRNGIGSVSFGGLTTDQTNGSSQLFLHQAFLDFQARSLESYIGRTDTPTAQIVTFPTLRGDDLVTFTNLLNPFSNGRVLEEHRYADVAAITINQGLRTFENFHAQHLIDSSGAGGADGTGLNSYGFTFQYLNAPGLQAIQRIVSAGAGFEHRTVGRSLGGASDALFAGGVVNLYPSLTNRVDLRALVTRTFGNDLRGFSSIADTYRANATSVAASLRWLHSPFGVPGYQLALTGGFRTYDKVPGAGSYGLALTGVKRLGEGFDLVAQLLYQHRSTALAAAYGGARQEQAIQVGLVYNFDATFNKHVGPRRTLANLRHQYIPN